MFRNMTMDIRDTLVAVDALDPGSRRFRYPVSSTGTGHHKEHLVINILVFAEQLDFALDYLHGAVLDMDRALHVG
jgi:hypothetical protein